MNRLELGSGVQLRIGPTVGRLSAALLTLSLGYFFPGASAHRHPWPPPTEPASQAAAASAGSVPTQELTANDVEAFLDGRLAAVDGNGAQATNS